ncbi:cytochrome c3 family protein [Mesobacillus zeae]|uniref:cytochrome c3 family protein n=1 Tax=Mesobacillus zeae TaxID=1917180 RepID=UPI0015E776CA|nr:cytochrome c3 family protein [Mesobacillus zeae]
MKKLNSLQSILSPLSAVFLIFFGSVLLPFPSDTALSLTNNSTDPLQTEEEQTNIEENAVTGSDSEPSSNTEETQQEPSNTVPDGPPNAPESSDAVIDNTENRSSGTEEPLQQAVPLPALTASVARPFVTDIKMILPGESPISIEAEDMNGLPVNPKIQVMINSESFLKNVDLIINSSKGQLIHAVAGTPNIEGNLYTYTFMLDPLDYGTTYFVYISSYITDQENDFIYPKFFTFSTARESTKEIEENQLTANPHGSYMSNTNICANCHNTHMTRAPEESMYGGEQPKPAEGKTYTKITYNTGNYCMSCHDGTMGINQPENLDNEHTHFSYDKEVNSCTSCHNPHLTRTEKNPNLLKDHYVFDHNTSDKPALQGIGIQDSDIQLCETCHDPMNEKINVKTAATNKGNHYDKNLWKLEALGGDNKPLCFTCHNGSKDPGKLVDIEKYYDKDPAKINSGHYITAGDGSKGYLPCADCHETHGSKNIKQLRTKLGNAPVSDADQFTTSGQTWTVQDERTFCLKCHNGTKDFYGKQPSLKTTDSLGANIAGHQESDSAACSSCHADSYDTSDLSKGFLEAAHSPKR